MNLADSQEEERTHGHGSLCKHSSGDENTTRQIAIAETLEASLCYKNEHSITLNVSLTRYQRIFTIHKDEEEANDEKATIRYSDISVASSD